ncbi:sunset domain-containing protein [Leucobacter sp. USHLN153]|uniref:sunset domain-containing protein n=1 Tax=Leucobacter sp. USHLN153 TaxID=3081268 RepID=UPI0030181933
MTAPLRKHIGVVLATALTFGFMSAVPAYATESPSEPAVTVVEETTSTAQSAETDVPDPEAPDVVATEADVQEPEVTEPEVTESDVTESEVTEPEEPTTPEPTPAVTSSVPKISGSAFVGTKLTAKPGTWTEGATLRYQWLADGAVIASATKSTFTIAAAQSGKAISVEVTGSKAGYSDTVETSAATLRVMSFATPKVTGTAVYGSKLTAKPGTWTSGTRFAYQWYANGKSIKGATKSTLKLASAQKGKKITVRVTGSKVGHPTKAVTSKSTTKVAVAGRAKATGSALVGSKLTAKPGTWTSGTKFSYQWYANGKAISKAQKSTFKVTNSQRDKAITVKITGKKSGYTTVAKTSSPIKKVPRSATPAISGTKTLGSTLTAKTGTWSKGTKFTYRWYANGTLVKSGASSKLKLTSSHLGKSIKVKVTGKKGGYTTATTTSKATANITYPSRTTPSGGSWNCPAWAPIKGNASSMIYHVPGGAFYSRTNPEECFSTPRAAEKAGYRASLR